MGYIVTCPQCNKVNPGSRLNCIKCQATLVGIQRMKDPISAETSENEEKTYHPERMTDFEKKLVVIPKMTGTEENVTVTFRDVVFQEKEDASRQFLHPEFGAWLIEQLYKWEKIFATKKGLFKKSYWCASCGAELDVVSRTPKESSYKLQFSDFPPFYIDISMPSVVCPQCKKTNGVDFDGTLEFNLGEAMLHAFRSKDVRP